MDEYPDEDEYYESMHAEELEMMRDMEDFNHEDEVVKHVPPNIKRSLQFASPESTRITNVQQTEQTETYEENPSTLNTGKRIAPTEFDDDLDEFLSDNFMENRSKKKKVSLPNVELFAAKDPHFDRIQYETDLSIIEMIVEERDRRRRNELLETKTEVKKKSHDARVYRHVPEGAFQALTTESGKRFYLTVVEEEEWEQQLKYLANTQKCIHLLNTPYYQLRKQADKEQERQNLRRLTTLEPVEEDSGTESGIDEDEGSHEKSLWVERYKPRHYLDLLSDEATNRCVLQWMKLWDKLVFGRERKVKTKKEEVPNDKGFFKKKFFPRNAPEVLEEWDEHGRPVQKVILMSGPPGLGKTTLAHIIARHAGYNVVEMNASDDRSVDTFKTNLENATSMRSVIGKDPRPNCLIIDEIDGAPAPSINLLVSMLQGKDVSKKPKKKGGKEGPKLMQRPILCICNDVFTPALRPLKMMAMVVQFLPTQTSKLAQRLFDIARNRQLKTDLTVLMALCDKTENDIRSCLSALQFIRATKKKVQLDDIESVSVGQKDYQRSLFNVWHDIFSIPRLKKKRRVNPHEVKHKNGVVVSMNDDDDADILESQTSVAARFSRILLTTQSCGEYDKLTQGWFENYLTIKFKHAYMEPVSEGLTWAEFTDTINLQILRGQNWNLMAYLPYACVSYHMRFAGNTWPKITFPTQLTELSSNQTKCKNLMDSMVSEMTPQTRVFVSVTTLVQDVLPYLLHIIQPNLRPVNTQLYSKAEKHELFCLLDTMISYNLTYTQERTPEGQYLFNLDPNVEEVIRFTDIKPSKQLTYAARNLIAREVEIEKVRRSEAYFAAQVTQSQKKSSNNKCVFVSNKVESNKVESNIGKVSEKPTKEATSTSAIIPNHLQKLEAKKINETEGAKAAKDFFGRVIPLDIRNQIEDKKNKDKYNNEIVKSDIWFKFKEGFSNAVRRTIKMKDL